MFSYSGRIPSEKFEFKPRDMPAWARRRMLEEFRESQASYLKHEPARPIATPAAVPMKRLFPDAQTVALLPELTLPEASVGGIKIGVEPLTDQWSPKNRYDLWLKFHDNSSFLGFHSSYFHEYFHVIDAVSFAGLPYLLAPELKIAQNKPIGWDPQGLRAVLSEALKRLRPAQRQPWKTLAPQLEAYPTDIQLLALSKKEYNEDQYRTTGYEDFRIASKIARSEYGDLFRQVLDEADANEAHRRSRSLLRTLRDKGMGAAAPFLVSWGTHLGFVGLPILLWLAEKTGKKFEKALDMKDPEKGLQTLLEVADLSLKEYRRTLLRTLGEATSSAQGNSRTRFRVLRTWVEPQMRRPLPFLGYGAHVCVLMKVGGKPYIRKNPLVSDSDVEASLGFYVDAGLTSKVEKPVEKYLKQKRAGLEKPCENILICPLWGAMQPRWCPGCGGNLRVEVKSEAIRYEPMENLNQKCPIIKEWLGEKRL